MLELQAAPNRAPAGKRGTQNPYHRPLMLDQAILAVGAQNIILSIVIPTPKDLSLQPNDPDVLSLVAN